MQSLAGKPVGSLNARRWADLDERRPCGLLFLAAYEMHNDEGHADDDTQRGRHAAS
jgi:hypothetical protein